MKRKRYRSKISKAERTILSSLQDAGFKIIPQFRIEGLPYLFDFYLPDLNILLEYQGDYFHANPKKYESGSLIKMVKIGIVFVDYIWARDQLKRQLAEKQGYKVFYLWESDYKKHGIKILLKMFAGQ